MIHPSMALRTRYTLYLLLLLCFALACNTLTGGAAVASQAAAPTVAVTRNVTFGAGAFTYADPKAGLVDLASYTATLKMSFDGNLNGNPEKWTKTYTLLSTKTPQVKQWTIEGQENGTAAGTVLQFEMNGFDYIKDGTGACRATAINPGNPLSRSLEPAAFLGGVIGAEEAGAQKVNKIAATHYTFDQHALGEDGFNQSTGEMWVATDGSYLVKYVLSKKAGPDFFGSGYDGTLSYDYELTRPDVPVTINLPADCPPGLVNAPPLPDATNVQNSPGAMSFDSATAMADAAAFYVKQLPPLGWTAQGDPAISDKVANLNFTSGSQAMIITIDAADKGINVTIFVAQNQGFP
jgi:hypothetical protein